MVKVEYAGPLEYGVFITDEHEKMIRELATRSDETCVEVLALVIVRGLTEFENDYLMEGK